ncbi:GNAT family N-acetyltransferase [Curtobacterium flaccumfaciens pv. flaccumfaciens]
MSTTVTTTAPDATAPGGAEPGLLTVEPVDPERDAAVVQSWLAHPASSWWEMGDLDVDAVRAYLAGVQADPAQAAWLGRRNGEPCFLAETYDPSAVLLTDVWAAEPGDVGMHLLVAPAPADRRVHGLTSAVMRAVVEHCRDALGARRVVVEPDVRNTAVQAKNAEVGFRALRQVDVDGKRALLSVLDTDRIGVPDDDGPAAHLRPEHLEPAERHLVAKAIAEFTHERLIAPVPDGDGWRLDAGGVDLPVPGPAARARALVDGRGLADADPRGGCRRRSARRSSCSNCTRCSGSPTSCSARTWRRSRRRWRVPRRSTGGAGRRPGSWRGGGAGPGRPGPSRTSSRRSRTSRRR